MGANRIPIMVWPSLNPTIVHTPCWFQSSRVVQKHGNPQENAFEWKGHSRCTSRKSGPLEWATLGIASHDDYAMHWSQFSVRFSDRVLKFLWEATYMMRELRLSAPISLILQFPKHIGLGASIRAATLAPPQWTFFFGALVTLSVPHLALNGVLHVCLLALCCIPQVLHDTPYIQGGQERLWPPFRGMYLILQGHSAKFCACRFTYSLKQKDKLLIASSSQELLKGVTKWVNIGGHQFHC